VFGVGVGVCLGRVGGGGGVVVGWGRVFGWGVVVWRCAVWCGWDVLGSLVVGWRCVVR